MFEFFSEVKNELAKVVWPTQRQTVVYTFTVIVFSIVIAAILGAFDYGVLRVMEAILAK